MLESPLPEGKVLGPRGLRAHLSQVWVTQSRPCSEGRSRPWCPGARVSSEEVQCQREAERERPQRSYVRRGTRGPSRGRPAQTLSHMTGGGAWTGLAVTAGPVCGDQLDSRASAWVRGPGASDWAGAGWQGLDGEDGP